MWNGDVDGTNPLRNMRARLVLTMNQRHLFLTAALKARKWVTEVYLCLPGPEYGLSENMTGEPWS